MLVDVYRRHRHRTLADRGTVGEGCSAGKGKVFLYARSHGRSCGHHDQRCFDDHGLRDYWSEKAATGAVIRSGYTIVARTRRVAFQEGHDGELFLCGAAPRHHHRFEFAVGLPDGAPVRDRYVCAPCGQIWAVIPGVDVQRYGDGLLTWCVSLRALPMDPVQVEGMGVVRISPWHLGGVDSWEVDKKEWKKWHVQRNLTRRAPLPSG